jgi:hypothetical protein
VAEVHIALLPAPAADYLTLEELAIWLNLKDGKTVRRYIRRGHIEKGRPIGDGKRLYWSKLASAIAKYKLDNLDRYELELAPEEAETVTNDGVANRDHPPKHPQKRD